MAKIMFEDITGGQNFNGAGHLIEDNEAQALEEVSFRNGRWEKRSGYTEPYSATADALPIIEMADYIRRDGTVYLMCLTTDRAFRLNGTAWSGELDMMNPLNTTDKWFTTEFLGNFYIANGRDKPRKLTDPTSSNFSDLTTTTRVISAAKIILSFHQRLLFFNTTDGTDGEVPYRIQFTQTDSDTDVQNENWLDLDADSNSPIISAAVFKSNAIVAYKPDSVYLVQDVGDPYYFTARFAKNVGIIGSKARCTHPDGDFFVSNMGFYLFVGNGVIRVDNARYAFEYFASQLNWAKKANVYCWYDSRFSEIHIMYPTGANDEPDEEIVLSASGEQFAIHKLGGYCAFEQYRTVNEPVVYHGTTGGIARQRTGTTGNGETDNGATINTKFQSKAVRIDTQTTPTREEETFGDDYIQANRVLANISPIGAGGATARVGISDVGDSTPTWSTTAEFSDTAGYIPSADLVLDEVSGRYATVEIAGFDFLSSFDLDYTGAGEE